MEKEKTESKSGDIRLLYLNQFIRGIAFSFVGIFIPIYLFTLGHTFNTVLIYFLVFHLVTFIFTPVALSLSRKFGYKVIVICSASFIILFFISLRLLEQISIPIPLIAILGGAENAFYFIPLHAFFTRLSENQKRGKQFSNYASIGQLAGLVGPLIGGIIAAFFGFAPLFYITIFFIILSIFPLFKLDNVKPATKLTFSGIWHLTKTNKRFFFATIADNIKGNVEGLIWPIFIYFTLKNLISVGWVSSLVTGGAILFTLFIGRFHDKKSKYFFLKLGGLLYAILWLIRIYTTAPFYLYLLSILAGFFVLMIDISFNAIFYDKAAEKKDLDEFIIFREIPIAIGRIFLWTLMLFLIDKFAIIFILAGLASLYFIFFKFESKSEAR